MAKPENAEQYIERHPRWAKELRSLRILMLSYPLEETIKWGAPVYTYKDKNLIGIGAFKNHYALWFFQGGLLTENTSLLVNAQEGKTQALRQIKFHEDQKPAMNLIRKYIEETIKLAREGKTIQQKNPVQAMTSSLLLEELEQSCGLKKAFQELTPGKQKEYHAYIEEAKREQTKNSRLQ